MLNHACSRAINVLLIAVSACLLVPATARSSGTAPDGEAVFQQKCASCHTIGGGRMVGPDLQGVTERRDKSWLVHWIAEPDKVLAAKDPVAIQMLEEFGGIPMPNLGLSRGEVDAVLTFLKGKAGNTAGSLADAAPSGEKAPFAMSPLFGTFAAFGGISLLVFFIFAYVGLSTRRPCDINMKDAYRVRRKLSYVLAGVLVVGAGVTIPNMPYPARGERPDVLIHAAAKQFTFAFSTSPVADSAAWAHASTSPVEVPAGVLVEFRVTSLDVNHGFGIYTPDGRLVAQTQAMPGYVNRLRVRFDKPGRYSILCLEYCGMAHHQMRGTIMVKDGRKEI